MRKKISAALALVIVVGFPIPAIADDLDLTGPYIGASVSAATSNSYTGYSGITSRYDAPYLGGVAGYNLDLGDIIIGIEGSLDGQLDDHVVIADRLFFPPNALPSVTGYSVYSPGAEVSPQSGHRFYYDFSRTYGIDDRLTYTEREMLAGQLGARVGWQSGNLVLFGRISGGFSRIEYKTVDDDTRSTNCNRFLMRDDYFPGRTLTTVVSCIGPYNGQKTNSIFRATYPSAALAIGAEYHFDNHIFTRVEGEARRVFLDWYDGHDLDSFRARFVIGVRF